MYVHTYMQVRMLFCVYAMHVNNIVYVHSVCELITNGVKLLLFLL